jgi:hypothetical protein
MKRIEKPGESDQFWLLRSELFRPYAGSFS